MSDKLELARQQVIDAATQWVDNPFDAQRLFSKLHKAVWWLKSVEQYASSTDGGRMNEEAIGEVAS